MLSASDTSPMPPSSRSSAVVISFFSERASRSSFHTTSTSPLDACQCRPVRLGAGRLLGMDLLAAGTPERVELQLGRLVGGADSGVPDPHPTSLFSKPIRLVAFRNRAIKGGYEKGKCLDARPRAARARDRQKRWFARSAGTAPRRAFRKTGHDLIRVSPKPGLSLEMNRPGLPEAPIPERTGAMTSKTTNKFSPEVRARAVRMVLEYAGDHPSRWAAVVSIAEKIGCVPQTLREWLKKVKVDEAGPGSVPRIAMLRESDHSARPTSPAGQEALRRQGRSPSGWGAQGRARAARTGRAHRGASDPPGRPGTPPPPGPQLARAAAGRRRAAHPSGGRRRHRADEGGRCW